MFVEKAVVHSLGFGNAVQRISQVSDIWAPYKSIFKRKGIPNLQQDPQILLKKRRDAQVKILEKFIKVNLTDSEMKSIFKKTSLLATEQLVVQQNILCFRLIIYFLFF